MKLTKRNIFADMPERAAEETFQTLLANRNLRLERIVSRGHRSPQGYWYDQEEDEWVLLLKGGAQLLFEGRAEPVELCPGDFLLIPAHARHRVAWTAPEEETVWLALHFAA